MNDIKEISDAAKALSAPVMKFIEVCASGIGKVYEPTHIVRMAKANAKAHSILSGAFIQNPLVPSTYNDDKISLDATDSDSIITRMQSRFQFQEVKKQINTENIISEAYSQIKADEQVSSEKVDEDWITRFFNYAGDVSNEEMQILWGAILAGEVRCPGSFSLKTLEVLRSITKEEAETFRKIISYVMATVTSNCEYYFLINNLTLLSQFDISLFDISKLSDIGLINPEPLYMKNSFSNTPVSIFTYQNKIIFACTEKEHKTELSTPMYKLTKVSYELYAITEKHYNHNFISTYAHNMKTEKNVNLIYGDILKTNGKGQYEYSSPLKEF